METILFYFIISHLVFLTQLHKDYDFNLKLANSYLWPTFMFKKLHNYLALKLARVFDYVSLLNEPFRNICTKIYFKLRLYKLF